MGSARGPDGVSRRPRCHRGHGCSSAPCLAPTDPICPETFHVWNPEAPTCAIVPLPPQRCRPHTIPSAIMGHLSTAALLSALLSGPRWPHWG